MNQEQNKLLAHIVRDAVNAAALCYMRHPAVRLTKPQWVAGGIVHSLKHTRDVAKSANPQAFGRLVGEYVMALVRADETEASEIVCAHFQVDQQVPASTGANHG